MSRRFVPVVAGLIALALIATACGGEEEPPTTVSPEPAAEEVTEEEEEPVEEPSGVLRLFSYSDGFDVEYIAGFHELYPDVELKTSAFESNDAAVAKLLAGFEADVVNSCVDESTQDMVERGLYQPLDVSRLENWDDIFPKMKELPGVVVDGEVYLVPVDAGTAGIMYNVDEVTDPPTSWIDLFDERYAGRSALEDLSVTAIDIGALATGISDPLNMTEDQLASVKDFLIQNKGKFRTFWKGEASVKQLFKSGEIVIASGYPGTVEAMKEDGLNVEFTVAAEGQMLWACGYGISSEAENIDAAYALLNYYSSVPPQLYAAENFRYQTSNSKILEAASPELIEAVALDSFAERSTVEGDSPLIPATPPKNRRAWTEAWNEVKAA